MAIAFRSQANAQADALTLTITKPTGTAQYDVLIALISWNGNPTITPPADWTLIKQTVNGTAITLATYYLVAGAAEPANYAWVGSKNPDANGIILAYSGGDRTSPLDVSSEATGNSNNLIAYQVTTSLANELIITAATMRADTDFTGSAFFPPGTKRVEADKATVYHITVAAWDLIKSAPGMAGPTMIGATDSANWCAQLIAIKENPVVITLAAGIATAEAFGTATLDMPLMIWPSSIASVEALGTPEVRFEGVGTPEVIPEIILTENNLFLIAEVVPNTIETLFDDIVDWPPWLVKYVEYGVLERAFGAESDGHIPSLKDYWKQRKDVGIQAILKFKRMRLADRTFVMGGGRAKGRGRGPTLPDGYPRVD